MKILRCKKGYTLTEVMVSVMILSMATTALVGLLMASMRSWSSGAGQEDVTNNATIALQKFINQVRDGKNLQIVNGKLQVTFPRVITNIATSEEVYDNSVNGAVTSFFVQSGNLVSQQDTSGPIKIVAKGVYSATFTIISGGQLDVMIESREQATGKLCKQQVSGRVALRNYR